MALKTVNDNMREFFRVLQLGGRMTDDMMRQYLNQEQINELRKHNYLKESTHTLKRKTLKNIFEKGGISKETYEAERKSAVPNLNTIAVSSNGRKFASKQFGLKDMHSSTSAWHDVILTCKVRSLSPSELESAKPEKQVATELKNRIREFRNNPDTRDIYRAKMDELNNEIKNFEKEFMKKNEYGSPSDLVYKCGKTEQWISYEVTSEHYTTYNKAVKEFSSFVQGYTYMEEES